MSAIQTLVGMRKRIRGLAESISDEDAFTIPEGFENNIAWNVCHLVVTQQLLCYKLSGLPMAVDEDTISMFMKGSSPADWKNKPDLGALYPKLTELADAFAADYEKGIFQEFTSYTTSAGIELTNIDEALKLGIGRSKPDGERVPILVFLTDGVPTVGATDPTSILAGVRGANRSAARVFVLGVGNDVNTFLLDSLAGESGGTRDYIRPNEDIELKTAALFTKLANPVLTDLQLDVDGIEISRVVPGKLADLHFTAAERFGPFIHDPDKALVHIVPRENRGRGDLDTHQPRVIRRARDDARLPRHAWQNLGFLGLIH